MKKFAENSPATKVEAAKPGRKPSNKNTKTPKTVMERSSAVTFSQLHPSNQTERKGHKRKISQVSGDADRQKTSVLKDRIKQRMKGRTPNAFEFDLNNPPPIDVEGSSNVAACENEVRPTIEAKGKSVMEKNEANMYPLPMKNAAASAMKIKLEPYDAETSQMQNTGPAAKILKFDLNEFPVDNEDEE